MQSSSHKPSWLATFLVGVLGSLILFIGCAAQDNSEAYFQNSPTISEEGQNLLFGRQVLAANRQFDADLKLSPNSGYAAVGKAITDLLLVPYSQEVNDLIRRNLGGSKALDPNVDVLYSDGGLLYLLSRGVPFEDGDSFRGIKTLLIEKLPWSSRQLNSVDDFVNGLDTPVSDLMDSLVDVAELLGRIQTTLDIGIADQNFKTFFVPGEVFHDKDLSVVLSKTELRAIQTVLSGTRAAIYFAAAYDWPFSLEEAFGSRWNEIDPTAPEFVEGYDSGDYIIAFLDTRVFRTIRDADRLLKAREQFKAAASNLVATLKSGQTPEYTGELDFTTSDDTYIDQLSEFITAVSTATDQETILPFTDPSTSMNLTSFFEPGRTLAQEVRWTERVIIEDEFGSYDEWDLTDAAFESIFIEGVFNPGFTVDKGLDLMMDGDASEFSTSVAGTLQEDVEDAYFSGR